MNYIKFYIDKNEKILYSISHKEGYFDMNEEQKRFKILKKESYEQQISEKEKQITCSIFDVGKWAAGAVVALTNADPNDYYISMLGLMVLGGISAVLSIKHMRILIESICEKTMLQGKVEDIVNELEMLEIEKKGRSI